MRFSKVSVATIATMLLAAFAARADYISDTLGAAGPGNYALLALSSSSGVQIAGANNQPPLPGGGVLGNAGVASTSATFGISSPASVSGNLYLAGSSSQLNASSPSVISGSVVTGGAGPNGTTLAQANTAALSAAAAFAALTPTTTVSGNAVTGTTTINAKPNANGVTVVNLSGINLGNGQSLTLNGSAGSMFVVNVSGNVTLNSGKILLSGGVTANDVVINMTGGGTVSTAGGLNNESVINGIVLDPTGNFQLTPGLVNGEIIGGGKIALASGATIAGTPPSTPSVPEPASMILMAIGGLGMAAFVRSRRKALGAANAGDVAGKQRADADL